MAIRNLVLHLVVAQIFSKTQQTARPNQLKTRF